MTHSTDSDDWQLFRFHMNRILALLMHSGTTATLWTMAGVMFANAGAFVYVFVMARSLTPANYAIIVTCTSIFGLLAVPAGILQLVVVRLVAEAKGKKQEEKITALLDYFQVKIAIVSCVLALTFALVESRVDSYLHIADGRLLMIIVGAAIAYYFITVSRSVLLGIFAFKPYAFSGAVEMVFRVGLAVSFVLFGFALLGAVASVLLTYIVAFLYTFQAVKKHLAKKSTEIRISHKEILTFFLPAFFLFLGTTSFYTSDVILVKHYFSNGSISQAALYTGVSTLGKIIFFGVFGITSALLPLATARYTKKQPINILFWSCFGFAILYCLFMVAVYTFFPHYVLLLLGNVQYQFAKNLLGQFAIFIALQALVFFLANFLFSMKRLVSAYVVFISAVAQIFGITVFHQSLTSVVTVSTICSLVAFAVLLGYTLASLRTDAKLTAKSKLFEEAPAFV